MKCHHAYEKSGSELRVQLTFNARLVAKDYNCRKQRLNNLLNNNKQDEERQSPSVVCSRSRHGKSLDSPEITSRDTSVLTSSEQRVLRMSFGTFPTHHSGASRFLCC